MKNLHLLESKQPCRLHYYSHMHDLGLSKEPLQWKQGRNIYITIGEKFVKDEYVTDGIEIIKATSKLVDAQGLIDRRNWNKIVLTTDINLIKDGVEEISDKFLKWFIRNPTCELVGVMSYCKHGDECPSKGAYDKQHLCHVAYNINVATLPKSKVDTFIKCYDKYNQLLKEGDYVDVQRDGVHQIYKKEDGQLYFKPYGEEDRVSAYFSNDIAKCDADGNWINNDRYEDIEEPKTYFGKEIIESVSIGEETVHIITYEPSYEEPKLTLELTKAEARGLMSCILRTSAKGTDLDVGEMIEDKLAIFLNIK